MLDHFFDLIAVALGHRSCLSASPTEEEWQELFVSVQRQALLGVLYPAIESLPKEQRPPEDILLQWYVLAENIKHQNNVLSKRADEACRYFKQHGFDSVVMKGVAVASCYPRPELRMPGDIDIWVAPKDLCLQKSTWLRKSRRAVAHFIKGKGGLSDLSTHHVSMNLFDDVTMEVHFKPSYLYDPLAGCQLNRYFERQAHSQFHNHVEIQNGKYSITALNADFNRYFILLHIFRHYFGEGIGLRQLMDYYYVLLQEATPEGKAATVAMFRKTGMYRFACATMWLMQRVFALPDEYLLCPPDARLGKKLLREVIRGGNFGRYDDRLQAGRHGSVIYRVWYSFFQRNLSYVFDYPRHVLWDIPFRTYQVIWRNIFPHTV